MRGLYSLFNQAKEYFKVPSNELIAELMQRPYDLQFQAFFDDDVIPEVIERFNQDPTMLAKLDRLERAAREQDSDAMIMNAIGSDDRQGAISRVYQQIGLPTQVAENYSKAIDRLCDKYYDEMQAISRKMGRGGDDDALQGQLEQASLKMNVVSVLGQEIAKGIDQGAIQTVKSPQLGQ